MIIIFIILWLKNLKTHLALLLMESGRYNQSKHGSKQLISCTKSERSDYKFWNKFKLRK